MLIITIKTIIIIIIVMMIIVVIVCSQVLERRRIPDPKIPKNVPLLVHIRQLNKPHLPPVSMPTAQNQKRQTYNVYIYIYII